MPKQRVETPRLPTVCYVRHPDSGQTVMIVRERAGFLPIRSALPPHQLNAGTATPPTDRQVMMMLHGALFGWSAPQVTSRVARTRPVRQEQTA